MLKLLAVGDMHLGRRPSRLPEELAERATQLGPTGAWHRTVDTAIEEAVDVVALAGDVVEREDDFYEGYRELHDGVERLKDAGIAVIGVAGNHDVRVLPRLADQLPDFHLLGRQGEWEAKEFAVDGETLTLWGWSFPKEQVRQSPLAGARFDRPSGINLGLLHCDRDQVGSPYAPVTSTELQAAGLDGWLLGHIHVPDALSAEAPIGYLGSVTGMDPGETGDHGPWLLTLNRGQIESIEQHVIAPLRWERLPLDLSTITDPADVRPLLLEAVQDLDTTLMEHGLAPEAVGLRVQLTGRTNIAGQVVDLFKSNERGHIHTGTRGSHYFIEKLAVATRPAVDLETLAQQSDPPGLLARRLMLLDAHADNPERQALLEAARRDLGELQRSQQWQALAAAPLDDETVAEWLHTAGIQLLEQMLAQREDPA